MYICMHARFVTVNQPSSSVKLSDICAQLIRCKQFNEQKYYQNIYRNTAIQTKTLKENIYALLLLIHVGKQVKQYVNICNEQKSVFIIHLYVIIEKILTRRQGT